MIVRFVKRCLEGLNNLVGLDSAFTATDQIDLGPAALAFDLTALAQASMGFYATAQLQGDTAGAGVAVFAAADPFSSFTNDARFVSNLQARGLTTDQVQLFLLAVTADMSAASTGNLSSIFAGYEEPNVNTSPLLLALFNNEGNPLATGGRIMLRQPSGELVLNSFHRPFPLGRNGRLLARFQDDAGGAVSALVSFHIWVTPRGVLPLGG